MAGRPKGSKNKATILRENAEAQAKIRRMMAEDDGPAYFVCACCGKRFMHQKDNFSPAQSELWRGNNHYFPVCKSCMDMSYSQSTARNVGEEWRRCEPLTMWLIFG